MADVQITWYWINIRPEDAWSDVARKLDNAGINLKHLTRSVYVIRAASAFCISYPKKHSPTIYIGEGRFMQRITQHRKWLSTLDSLTGAIPLEVAICTPRVRNNLHAHQEFEAHLLRSFYDKYGSLPLKNKINEYNYYNHTYKKVAVNEAIDPGRGKRYKWAIQPLPSNPFYKKRTSSLKAAA